MLDVIVGTVSFTSVQQFSFLMNNLLLHGRNVDTVFGLMGRHENDMTRALGWTINSD